ncbi:MAG: type II toxin-antitoxin system HipA family toxin [Acidobacteria bacterium]|nr:type II toxin-antitoxin system HipA family toxin [Acidobacteriota bacterium]
MNGRRGTVWHEDRRVGALREDEDRVLRFAYDGAWLDGGGFPVSIHLPLSLGDEEVDAHAFFAGLLPEGGTRQRVCRQRGIAPEDDAGLLFAIGEDCAGALSVLPAGVEPETRPAPPETLTQAQIDLLVRSLGEQATLVVGERQRFSLAGTQEKQPVIFDGESYALPDRANPSSHLLKFETVRWVCVSECIANDIARQVGLPVVQTEFVRAGTDEGVPFLQIDRYDRARGPHGRLTRLHQEDLLQSLGLSNALKYQRDGGPSLGDVAELLRTHTAHPAEALAHLRDWQILNCLIGNWDGHAKNLALLYGPEQAVPTLAPFYDLISIEFLNLLHPGTWAREMAFCIGEHDAPERITRTDWSAFADELGMPPRRLLDRVRELANELPGTARAAREAFALVHGDAQAYGRLEEAVRRRCRWTLDSLGAR